MGGLGAFDAEARPGVSRRGVDIQHAVVLQQRSVAVEVYYIYTHMYIGMLYVV